jgi:multisubunit Na+/H+ antiporter MnhE subunit
VQPQGRIRYAVFAAANWLSFLLLYLVLAGQFSGAELLAGAFSAGIAAFLLTMARSRSRHHFRLPAHSLGKLLRLPAEVLADCARVFLAVLRRPAQRQGSGRFQVREFEPGNQHPTARARRALVTLAISWPPNSFVLGLTPNEKLLVHQLLPQPAQDADPRWPL